MFLYTRNHRFKPGNSTFHNLSLVARQEIKLSTLKKMADGLGVKFLYGFVLEQDLKEIVREQAEKIARKRLGQIDHSMKLDYREYLNLG